jgi:hypothetical protein
MMKLRVEVHGKVYDTETAELVEAGWKLLPNARVLAARFVAGEASGRLQFTVEIGNASRYMHEPMHPDFSRVTLLADDAEWHPSPEPFDMSSRVRRLFGKAESAS